ncbi:MAG TPA: methyltransferase [Candidatus Bathyarchaeia archaeon]
MSQKRQRHDHYFTTHPQSEVNFGLIKTRLHNVPFEFLTAASVFSKKRVDTGTRLLVETMILPKSGYVLDVGCGYGAVGIAAAIFHPSIKVVMTDVNIRAVHLAKENIERNRVKNARVKRGYLYEPVKDLNFNCVLSNPPVSAGIDTVKALIMEAPKVLAEKAMLQMVVRSKIAGKILPAVFETTFGNCEVLSRKSGYRVLTAEKVK